MHRLKKLLMFSLVFVIGFGITQTTALKTYAYESNKISESDTKTQLFAVPEGGWSSIKVNVNYVEYYVPGGSTNNFLSRDKSVLYNSVGATTNPTVSLGNVKHSNGKTFSNWSSISIVYDNSKWNEAYGRENTTSVTYSKSTSVTGKLAYTLSCSGGTPTTVAGSVNVSLKTN